MSGSLWIISLDDLLNRNPEFIEIATSSSKGFEAPVSIADFNSDNILDVVAICFDGTLFVINGADRSILLQRTFLGYESVSQPAIGYFNEDSIPDISIILYEGVYPDYSSILKLIINGKDLSTIYSKSEDIFTFYSALAIDINHDGIDEAVWVNNQYDSLTQLGKITTVYAFDLASQDSLPFYSLDNSHNKISTPTFEDIDDNGFLDLIYCHTDDSFSTRFIITRVSTAVSTVKAPSWGQYLGTGKNSVLDNRTVTAIREMRPENPFIVTRQGNDFYFKSENVALECIRVYDMLGKNLKKYSFSESTEAQINLSGLSVGIYTALLFSKQGTHSLKLTVY